MMTSTQFRSMVRGPQAPQQKVRNSWGVYDYYKYYRKTKPKGHEYVLTESQYFAIIRKINQKLADQLLRYEPVQLPLQMGVIEIFRKPVNDQIVDGRLKTDRLIDWDKTLELWYNDPEEYKKKTLIRYEWKEKFLIKYFFSKALFTNRSFYEFRANKSLAERLMKQVKDGFTDAPYFLTGEENNIKGLYNNG